MPAVSVIIPVYKVEPYMARCARSLFSQTMEDLEFIFIDDCSPDRSIDVMREVLEEFPERKDQVVRVPHAAEQRPGGRPDAGPRPRPGRVCHPL